MGFRREYFSLVKNAVEGWMGVQIFQERKQAILKLIF